MYANLFDYYCFLFCVALVKKQMNYTNNHNLDSGYVPINVPHLNSFTKVVIHANKKSHEKLKQAAVAKKLDLQRLAATIQKGSKGGFFVLDQHTQKKTYIPKKKVQQMKRKLSAK